MGRRRQDALRKLEEERKKTEPKIPVATDDYWDELTARLGEGNVIPIISNSLRCDHIFDVSSEQERQPLGERRDRCEDPIEPLDTLDELLAQMWAKDLGYPFPDRKRLARVAQYHLIEQCQARPLKAKEEYLGFLKETLLDLVVKHADPDAAERVDVKKHTFSHIARELDMPRFRSKDEDSLRLLARRRLKLYVTTSYYDFMERALRAEGRSPRTQICFWTAPGVNVERSHRLDRSYWPSVDEPVVFHLFGYEDYPSTMVLTEDDYVDFLVKVSQPVDKEDPIIPLYFTEALASSTLLLLGYRLQDWDFRILFRGIIHSIHSQLQEDQGHLRLAIQLKPSPQDGIEAESIMKAEAYLQGYFARSDFMVVWDDPDAFVKRLAG
jgi:hypothetical protein